MQEEKLKWYSPTLSMDTEMLVFGHSGYPLIIFPTSLGRYFESKDFGLIGAIAPYIHSGKVKVYCPDSVDKYSWYNKQIPPHERVKNHVYYDQFILNEVVDAIRNNHGFAKVAVAGASFGAYHAMNFAFRHPERVSHLFAMSGSFNIKSFTNGHYDDQVYFNNPVDYVPGLSDPEIWKMKIVLGVGEWDVCLDANQEMSEMLNRKNISHWYDFRRWAKHDWPLWLNMLPDYLHQL